MTKESASEMEQLYANIMQIHRTLETLQRPVEHWDDFFVFSAVQRLDAESVKAWEHNLGSSKEPPSWKQFSEFLITRLLSLQAFEKSRAGKIPPSIIARSHFQGKSKDNSSKSSTCSLCSSNHYIAKCPQYLSKSTQQRLALITHRNLCFNCLGAHRASSCHITKRCLKCGREHHTTIHGEKPASSSSGSKKSDDSSTTNAIPGETHVLHSSANRKTSSASVLLATAQVTVASQAGEKIPSRALLDQGSEISLVSERLVQLLRLPRNQSVLSLVGIGADKTNKTRGMVSLTLRPHFHADYECSISAHVLPKLTGILPSNRVEKQDWPHLKGLQLADDNFTSPGSIDIILGAEVYAQIIEEGCVKGNANDPIAQCTKLGWIISGRSGSTPSSANVQSYHVSLDTELYSLLHRFWELEEIPMPTSSSLSKDEQECERHFKRTYSRNEQGRFIVRLPFKHSIEQLGDSRSTAMRIMMTLSKKLFNNSDFSNSYLEFMSEYERLNHMVCVPAGQPDPPFAYYLPHHGILRKNSLTTKLRVVFNGSSRTNSNRSLNDVLHTGAKLQADLFDVLIWFRRCRYVFSTDIEKMYRQIQIHPADWEYQCIFWMDQAKRITSYYLTTVTYRLACAPFLVLRILDQLTIDKGAEFPLAVTILKRGRYVDDILGGGDSIPETQEMVRQLNQLCLAGGFPLQKWISNHPAILQAISPIRKIDSSSIQIDDCTVIHALGLCWKPSQDTFHFTINPPAIPVTTKRTLLSTIARLFDPLGLIAPVIIKAKILIQEVWSIKNDWDDPLPRDISMKWSQFINYLPDLAQLSFPRWIHCHSDHNLELQGFCDASQRAIAAVIYLRSITKEGNTTSRLVCSKTKVAPLKRLTVPRLELSGAVLLTKLIAHLLSILDLKESLLYLWTNSAITYTWINNHPSRWKDFVHNRVCYIQEALPQAIWKFVPGSDNPADCASRGLTPTLRTP